MRCPVCGKGTVVKDSRKKYGSIVRRRECCSCRHRFSTMETFLDTGELSAEKKDIKEKAFREAKPDSASVMYLDYFRDKYRREYQAKYRE